MAGPLKITVLGSGTSTGVPTIGCHCDVCTSADPRDNRLRPSILVSFDDRNVVIDTTPDFRTQALRARIQRLDAVLFTHSHADHVMGLDDVRPFNFRQREQIPIHASADTMAALHRCFHYVFDGVKRETNVPQIQERVIEGPFDVFGVEFTPVPILHGRQTILGYRFGNAAYLTDHSEIPESSIPLLQNLDVLFLDALRYKPHPTHSTVDRSIQTVAELNPRRAFFTHISHELKHERAESLLPSHIRLAYDGLEIVVDSDPLQRVRA
jgi:phosphoribosyl 1,2-cyclic phosphate phosphodiesterase